jgi:predicted phage gp36 major capsid-like protein
MTDQMTKQAPMTVAPQVKAVPDTVTAAFDEFMEAFEAFRETNDQRLTDIERKMGADVVTSSTASTGRSTTTAGSWTIWR